jgi:hypothetical protein
MQTLFTGASRVAAWESVRWPAPRSPAPQTSGGQGQEGRRAGRRLIWDERGISDAGPIIDRDAVNPVAHPTETPQLLEVPADWWGGPNTLHPHRSIPPQPGRGGGRNRARAGLVYRTAGRRHGAIHGGTVVMRMGLAGLLGVVLAALYVWGESWPVW